MRKDAPTAENFLWYVLRNREQAGYKFTRQFPVGPYFADFACRSRKLLIELDGGQHSNSESDAEQTAYLNSRGFSVLRFWNNEVSSNRDGVLFAIRLVLDGTPSPGLRYAPADLSPRERGIRGVAPKTVIIAAAVLLDDAGRMLVVKKRGSPFFMQPGGKIEPGESPIEAVTRELAEEVSLDFPANAVSHGTFSAPAANEPDTTVIAHIFSARTNRSPRIGREIEAMAWLDPAAPGDIELAPLTRDHMLPLARHLATQFAGELR